MKLLITWLINAAALFALPFLMSSVKVTDVKSALVAALVLSLVNTLIKPVLLLLTFPITFLTLGLWILIVNALLFWAVTSFVDGVQVNGFVSAFLASILYSVISWVLAALILK